MQRNDYGEIFSLTPIAQQQAALDLARKRSRQSAIRETAGRSRHPRGRPLRSGRFPPAGVTTLVGLLLVAGAAWVSW